MSSARTCTNAEDELLGAVSADRLEAWLEHFAQAGIRLAGTPTERIGAEYVAAELAQMGIDVELEEFDSFVSHGQSPEQFGPAQVLIAGESDPIEGRIFAFSAATPPSGVEAPVVWVGTGSPRAYEELGVDVRGCIAVCELSFDAAHSESARIAEERGALGLVVANWSADAPDQVHTSVAKSFWGNPEPDQLAQLPKIPVIAVSNRAGKQLRGIAGDGGRVTMRVAVDNRWARGVQPIATIPGKSQRFVLLYCHLDTLGPGMTDNTTGVVGLLEIGKLLSERRSDLEYTVKLAWFGCHEMLYNGSTEHLDIHWDEYYDKCVGALNVDSWAIGESEDQLMLWSFAELERFYVQAVEDGAGAACPATDFDLHEAEQTFWPLGVASAMVFSWNSAFDEHEGMQFTGPWWHSEGDTLEKVGRAALLQLTRAQALATYRFASAPLPPVRYSDLAVRLQALCREIDARSPEGIGSAALVRAADMFEAAATQVEAAIANGTAVGDVCWALMMVARTLNPTYYTVAGHYGQDPCSATYLRKRFPALQLELDELASIPPASVDEYRARFVKLRRERNRVCDAILLSFDLLRDICGAPIDLSHLEERG